jgi:hypothetical protein
MFGVCSVKPEAMAKAIAKVGLKLEIVGIYNKQSKV